MKECHKCPYNGKNDNHCLSCQMPEEYQYKYNKYVYDWVDTPDIDRSPSKQVTQYSEDTEDELRKMLYTILDLTPNQILLLKAIHEGKSLTEYAEEMEQISKKNQVFSRFRAFQTRKAILKNHPELSSCLIMMGQRRPLKQD